MSEIQTLIDSFFKDPRPEIMTELKIEKEFSPSYCTGL
jgi:hypothetical protein